MKYALLASTLICAPSPALAQGLIDQVNDLRCATAKAERAAFETLDGYAVSGVGENWIDITPDNIPTTLERTQVIDLDYDVPYRFIKIEVGPHHYLDYDNTDGIWDNTAWNVWLHLVRIDDEWAQLDSMGVGPDDSYNRDGATFHRGCGEFRFLGLDPAAGHRCARRLPVRTAPRDALTILQFAEEGACEQYSTSHPFCLRKFILKLPRKGRLTGIGDVESVSQLGTQDNAVRYDLKITGLAAPEIPESCS